MNLGLLAVGLAVLVALTACKPTKNNQQKDNLRHSVGVSGRVLSDQANATDNQSEEGPSDPARSKIIYKLSLIHI